VAQVNVAPVQSLAGKVVLITGASRGIGYAAAREAGRRGAHVIAIARTVGALEELDDEIQNFGAATTLVPMDLVDGDAIDRLGAAIFERWGYLDALVANAGYLATLSPLAHTAPDEWQKSFNINVTANYRLLRSLDLLLRQSSAARVALVSSGVAQNPKPYWGVYAATKAALEAMAKSYAAEMETTGVKVNVFNPPATRTAMRAKAMPGEDADSLPKPADIAPALVDLIEPSVGQTGQLYDFKAKAFNAL
jgi:NAD(P)-dependent dehydrogenase (short-subunit alcohol dehydrogenase family)